MFNKIFLILGIFAIIAVIPIANAQLSMGVEAYQKSIQLTVDENMVAIPVVLLFFLESFCILLSSSNNNKCCSDWWLFLFSNE